MHFDGPKNTQNTFDAKHSSLGDMLHNLMSSKPSFNTNLFSGEDKIYSSRYKWSLSSNEYAYKLSIIKISLQKSPENFFMIATQCL